MSEQLLAALTAEPVAPSPTPRKLLADVERALVLYVESLPVFYRANKIGAIRVERIWGEMLVEGSLSKSHYREMELIS